MSTTLKNLWVLLVLLIVFAAATVWNSTGVIVDTVETIIDERPELSAKIALHWKSPLHSVVALSDIKVRTPSAQLDIDQLALELDWIESLKRLKVAVSGTVSYGNIVVSTGSNQEPIAIQEIINGVQTALDTVHISRVELVNVSVEVMASQVEQPVLTIDRWAGIWHSVADKSYISLSALINGQDASMRGRTNDDGDFELQWQIPVIDLAPLVGLGADLGESWQQLAVSSKGQMWLTSDSRVSIKVDAYLPWLHAKPTSTAPLDRDSGWYNLYWRGTYGDASAFWLQRLGKSVAYGESGNGSKWDIVTQNFALEQVVTWLLLRSQSDNPALKDVRRMNIRGQLVQAGLRLDLSNSDDITLHAQIEGLYFDPVDNYPGMTNVSGLVYWSGTSGSFHIDSNDTSLIFNSYYEQPLSMNSVTGALLIDVSKTAVNIGSDVLHIDLPDVDTASFMKLNVHLPHGDLSTFVPRLDLHIQTSELALTKVFDLIPNLPPTVPIKKYLYQSIHAGAAQDANLLLWADLRGTDYGLDIIATADAVDMQMTPEWPNVDAFRGRVWVHQSEVVIDRIENGSLAGVELIDGQVRVTAKPDGSGDTRVHLSNFQARGTTPAGIDFLRQSPIWQTVGSSLEAAQTAGNIDVAIGQAYVDIATADGASTANVGEGVFTGSVVTTFDDSVFHWPEWGLKYTQVNGDLIYRSDAPLAIRDLKALLFGQPVDLTVTGTGAPQDLGSVTIIKQQAPLDAVNLQFWLDDWARYVVGQTVVNAEIALETGSEKPTTVIAVTSDLVGFDFNMFTPMSKSADQAVDAKLFIHVTDSDLPPRLQFEMAGSCGDVVALETAVVGGFWHGLPEQCYTAWSQPDIISHTELQYDLSYDTLDFEEFIDFVQASPTNPESTQRMNGQFHVAKTLALGRTFDHITGTSTLDAEQTEVHFSSEDLIGSAVVPLADLPTDVHIKYINMEAEYQIADASVDPTEFTQFNLAIDKLVYQRLEVQNIRASSFEMERGLGIHLTVDDENLQTLIAGWPGDNDTAEILWWYDDTDTMHTTLRGSVTSSGINKVLQAFELDKAAQIGKAFALFDLHWLGDPVEVGLENLRGLVTHELEGVTLAEETRANIPAPLKALIQVKGLLSPGHLFRSLVSNPKDLAWNHFRATTGTTYLTDGKITLEGVSLRSDFTIQIDGIVDIIPDDPHLDLLVRADPGLAKETPWYAALLAPVTLIQSVALWWYGEGLIKQASQTSSRITGTINDFVQSSVTNLNQVSHLWIEDNSECHSEVEVGRQPEESCKAETISESGGDNSS